MELSKEELGLLGACVLHAMLCKEWQARHQDVETSVLMVLLMKLRAARRERH